MSAEAERWREVRRAGRAEKYGEAGDALAAALEARDREHDAAIGRMVGEIEARDGLLEASQAEHLHWVKVATGLGHELEARDRRIAELEAGLRRIRLYLLIDSPGARIARDLLAGREAGGESPFRQAKTTALYPMSPSERAISEDLKGRAAGGEG